MTFHFKHCVMALGLVVCGAVGAKAQSGLHTSQLLYGGSTCDHVIQLVHLHGVNNSVCLASSHSMLQHSPLGAMMIPVGEIGDLEVINVAHVLHDDAACGPKIAVTVQNQSIRQVCNFHISAVAVLGRICPTSPNATVCVEKLEPGEALEVMVQLPIEALAMGNRNGQVIGFQRLVVAIDSYDEFVETNEANNVKAYDLSTLPVVTPSAVQTVETVSTTTQADVVQGTAGDNAGPAVSTPAPSADALQSAIQKLGAETQVAETSS